MFVKLMARYGLLFGLVLIGLFPALAHWSKLHQVDSLKNELLREARLIQRAIGGAPLEHIPERFAALFRDQGEWHLVLIDSNGQSLTGSEAPRSDTEQWVYQVVKLSGTRSPPVYLRLGRPLVFQSSAGLALILGGGALITFLGLIAISFLVARKFEQPLRDLAQAANRLRKGSPTDRVYYIGKDETGLLVQGFNRMAETLARQRNNLEAERGQLRAILGGMVEGVIALDARQSILFVNERARGLLDLQKVEPVGRKLWDVVRQRALLDVYQRSLEQRKPQQEALNWYGPENRNLTVHAAPLGGEPPGGAVLVIHDTTELRRLERLRQDFVANVSHELKTPLAVIQPCVETLLNGALEEPEPARRFLEQIAEQSERLHRLILDLLSLARIEAGAELFAFQQLDLSDLIHQGMARHRNRAEVKHQHLEAFCDDQAMIHADEEAISEILDNLIDNAVKYTPEGGRIALRCHIEDGHVVIQAEDSGIGIPPGDLPRVFERFYRVDKARSREMGGTGLGLAIVKHLVQAMNGTVMVESEPDKGTCFTLRFPLAK